MIARLHLAIVLHLTQLRSWWWGRGWCCPSYIIVGLLSTLSHRHYSATTWAYTNVRPTDKSATKCGRGWTTYSFLQIHLSIKPSYNYTYPLNCTHCIFSWLFLSRAQIRKYVSICLNALRSSMFHIAMWNIELLKYRSLEWYNLQKTCLGVCWLTSIDCWTVEIK